MNYERTTLKNGLRLITAYMPGMRSASINLSFSVGSRYEQDDVVGISHFIEHMLFKGTQKYPTTKLISQAIEGVGGSFNGSTGKEITNYSARVPGEYLSTVLDVMADMVRYSLFDAQEIEKERAVIIEELSSTQDDPQEWVGLLIDEVMWPGLPLGRDDAGTIESVSSLQRQQLLDYLDTYYRPDALVISVAGNIDHASIVKQVEDLFGDWQAQNHPKWMESLPPRGVTPVRLVKKMTEQTNIALATLGVAYGSEHYASLLLLNALLGDGMSSRLFQSIREDQGLAYDIGSYFNSFYETGSLVISAGVDPSHTRETIRAIVSELTRLCREPVPDDELVRIKAYVEGGVLLGLEGTHQVASWLGNQECLYNRIWTIDEILNEIQAVTVQNLQQVARTCFDPQWRRLAIIGPEDVRRVKQFETLLVDA